MQAVQTKDNLNRGKFESRKLFTESALKVKKLRLMKKYNVSFILLNVAQDHIY